MLLALLAAAGLLGVSLGSRGHGGSNSKPAGTCGSGCTAAAVPPALIAHPCTVLSNAAVARVFDEPVAYSQAENGFSGCTWAGPPFPNYGHKEVTVALAPGVTREEFIRSASSWLVPGRVQGTLERVPAARIRGVGNIAYYVNDGADLAVWYRGTVIYVNSVFLSSPLRAETQLARRVIARLAAEQRAARST